MDRARDIETCVQQARTYFQTGNTYAAEFRMRQLQALKQAIEAHEGAIFEALKSDLNKSPYESFMTEIGLVIGEIEYAQRHLKRWMKPKRLRTALTQAPASAKLYSDPYGVVLIMSPWNYPFQLTLIPLIGAIAAGNVAVIKPSAYSPATSGIVRRIVEDAFEPGYVTVVEGGRAENTALLEQHFDYIFFTGSPGVGKLVMRAASETLTPVTLELGGKSPCIVDQTADIQQTARRILFGKLLNLGQTCVAPDYILVHTAVKDALVEALKAQYARMVTDSDYAKAVLPRIVNEKHYKRILSLLEGQTCLFGGKGDATTRQMTLTLVDEPDPDSPLMQEEIFAPILPILTWERPDQVCAFVNSRPKPLALYLFTKDSTLVNRVTERISYGGGCINDTIIHISSSHQPFGGVGNSGMGHYHGKHSFETFSHRKTVVKKWWAFDLPVRYHPYKNPEKTPPRFLLK